MYPPEDFTVKKKYGLNILVTINDELQLYMKQVCSQLEGMQAAISYQISRGHSYWLSFLPAWLTPGKISKLVLVIKDKDTTEVVERWQFDIHVNDKSDQAEYVSTCHNPCGIFTSPVGWIIETLHRGFLGQRRRPPPQPSRHRRYTKKYKPSCDKLQPASRFCRFLKINVREGNGASLRNNGHVLIFTIDRYI